MCVCLRKSGSERESEREGRVFVEEKREKTVRDLQATDRERARTIAERARTIARGRTTAKELV